MDNNVRYTLSISLPLDGLRKKKINKNIVYNNFIKYIFSKIYISKINIVYNNILDFLGTKYSINDTMLIVLCNPASENGINDNGNDDVTINWIKNKLDLSEYFEIIIVNVIPLIGSKLNFIYSDDNNYLNCIKDINNKMIKDVLRDNNIKKILFACGQHFIQPHGYYNYIMRDYYIECWKEIYEILNNYRDILFCLGFTEKIIETKKLPYFPSNRILKNCIMENTIDGLKYKLIPYI